MSAREPGGLAPDRRDPEQVVADHVAALTEAIAATSPGLARTAHWGGELAAVLRGGGRLLAAGNGGSAAQAQHLTAELVGRFGHERDPFSAICLSAETSTLTALCNDYPPGELFARQVQAHGRPGDVLMLLSTSGRSPNLLAAARRGAQLGLRVWALTGPTPNPLATLAHEAITVPSGRTATVQEIHLLLLHLVCEGLDEALGVPAAAAHLTLGDPVVIARAT